MITFEQKKKVVSRFGKNDKDTGSPEVQIALLTERINDLAPHFAANPKDHNGNRGLMKMIGQRKNLLRYVQRIDQAKYTKLITDLGLRK
ncbi:MAG: 30S ribosomal protein S15 [Bdellovibrio sp.]|nr:30S ribosomal protein S15 [Bdellovibrio sp.]